MNTNTFIIRGDSQKTAVCSAIARLPLDPAYEVVIREHKQTRSHEQNAKLWAMLTDLAKQVNWHGQFLKKEEWKDIMTAALKRQKVVPGVDGGFVVLGNSTSRMKVGEMASMIELMYAFGAEHEVRWTDPEFERLDNTQPK